MLTLLIAPAAESARAGFILYQASDFGAGPTDPRPNSDAEAALFNSAASRIGSTGQITFEGLPLGSPPAGQSLTVASGVSLTLTNTDHNPPPGYYFGISNNPNTVVDGYNVTPGGSQYLEVVPIVNVGTATVDFHFASPTNAFGAYFTGVGTAAGVLHMVVNDGVVHDVVIGGSTLGGVQYVGFTDAGASISDVTFQLRDVNSPTSRDLFGIDNVTYTSSVVPEPSGVVLMMIGSAACVACACLRKIRNAKSVVGRVGGDQALV